MDGLRLHINYIVSVTSYNYDCIQCSYDYYAIEIHSLASHTHRSTEEGSGTKLCRPGMQLADVTTTLRKRWRVILMLQPGRS